MQATDVAGLACYPVVASSPHVGSLLTVPMDRYDMAFAAGLACGLQGRRSPPTLATRAARAQAE